MINLNNVENKTHHLTDGPTSSNLWFKAWFIIITLKINVELKAEIDLQKDSHFKTTDLVTHGNRNAAVATFAAHDTMEPPRAGDLN